MKVLFQTILNIWHNLKGIRLMNDTKASKTQSPKTPFLTMCRIRKYTFAMKNGLLFLFVAIILSFSSCSSKDELPELIIKDTQPTQQETTTSIQEVTEEPEFVIEADYDPALAKKAEENKRKKTEKTSPITLTSDDDDLEQDNDDLPVKVRSRSIRAYDYETTNNDIINDSDNNFKGGSVPVKDAVKENAPALYFVVAGAYKDESEAKKKMKIIEKLGYKVELISFDNDFKTVCVAKLENRSQADLLAKSLQGEKVDAYVVKRRK